MKKLLLLLILFFTIQFAHADDVTATPTPATIGLNNGTIALAISGGVSPYTFSWTGPGGFSSTEQNITGLAPGEYCVDVTDNYCGTTTVCVTVEEYQPNAITTLQPVEIQIAPNPFTEYLLVEVNVEAGFNASISITDIDGKIVIQKSANLISGANKITIDELNQLAAGQYNLVITNATQIVGAITVSKM